MKKYYYWLNKGVHENVVFLNRSIFFLLISFFLILIIGCTFSEKRTSNDISNTLNATISLEMIDSVFHENNYISFKEVQIKYKYISLVHLTFNCGSCYSRFVEWHNKIDSIGNPFNHAVLFVINGDSYDEFLSKVPMNSNFVLNQYVAIDPDDKFRKFNNAIPLMLLESSIMINSENKIKMIGAPFATPQMTELYRKICSQ